MFGEKRARNVVIKSPGFAIALLGAWMIWDSGWIVWRILRTGMDPRAGAPMAAISDKPFRLFQLAITLGVRTILGLLILVIFGGVLVDGLKH